MKIILIIAFCLISTLSFAQEINLGGGLGSDKEFNFIGLHSYIELRPDKSLFSLNIDPSFHTAKSSSFFTIPVYLKMIIGNKLRVCPSIGAFVRTNSNSGWLTNLNLEFLTSEKTIILAQFSLTTDYTKIDRRSSGSALYTEKESSKWIWFNVGIKRSL